MLQNSDQSVFFVCVCVCLCVVCCGVFVCFCSTTLLLRGTLTTSKYFCRCQWCKVYHELFVLS